MGKSCSFSSPFVTFVDVYQFVCVSVLLCLLVSRLGCGFLNVLVPDHCPSFYLELQKQLISAKCTYCNTLKNTKKCRKTWKFCWKTGTYKTRYGTRAQQNKMEYNEVEDERTKTKSTSLSDGDLFHCHHLKHIVFHWLDMMKMQLKVLYSHKRLFSSIHENSWL